MLDGIVERNTDDRDYSGRCFRSQGCGRGRGCDDLNIQPDQLCRETGQALQLSLGKTVFDNEVLPLNPSLIAKALAKGLQKHLGGTTRSQIPDARDLARLLLRESSHARRRQSECCKSDELPPPHSITSSARARRVGGKRSPSKSAALRLTTSSILVGCSTGRSDGFAPLKIRSMKPAARA